MAYRLYRFITKSWI